MAVVVPIVADTSGLSRGLKGAGSGLARFGKLAAVAIGVGVTAELYKSVKAAAEAEKSTQALRGQLKSLGDPCGEGEYGAHDQCAASYEVFWCSVYARSIASHGTLSRSR